jgi:hypothetical protein
MGEVVIELFREGQWRKAAAFSLYGANFSAGYRAKGGLSYDIDYALSCMDADRCGAEESLIVRLSERIDAVARMLQDARP